MSDERERIRFLVDRDGHDTARAWVERTRGIYREAIDSAASHAANPLYQPLFEQAIARFDEWLAQQRQPGEDC